jgi:acetyltransferase-like isoleucine patch superfamily enzyme
MLTTLKQQVREYPAIYGWLRRARGAVNARRHGLASQGAGSFVAASARIHPASRLDDYAYVGPECHISVPVSIGRYSMLAPRVAIVGADHEYAEVGTPIIFAGRAVLPPTTIGRDVWLGYGVIVIAGVTIDDGTIVGAGSVVASDLPAGTICVGNPARPIRPRFDTDSSRDAHLARLREPTRHGRFADPR